MKKRCLLLLCWGLWMGTASAAEMVKAVNSNDLNLGTSWVGGTAPSTNDIAVWDSTLTAANTASLGGNVVWDGLRIANPGGAIIISNSAAILTLGAAGINMSNATQNLALNANLSAASNQQWSIAGGRTLNLFTVNTSRGLTGSGEIILNSVGAGTATLVMLPGPSGSTGFSDANANSSFGGNWTLGAGVKVQVIRNGRTAWGTGVLNLAGGTAAQIQGNWTWTSPIILSNGTTSTLQNDTTGSVGTRFLKLQGILSGDGNLIFSDATATMGGERGFVLTGTNTLTGAVTINAGTPVRVGGVPGDNTSLDAGTGGTLGTATITNNGTLLFTRSDTHTVSNFITGTGLVRIGGNTIAASGNQVIILNAANSYTGGTTLHTGTLAVANASALGSGPLLITNTALLRLDQSLTLSSNLTGYSAAAINLGAGTVLTVNQQGSSTYAGILTNTGALVKGGGGVLTLSGVNTYAGGTTINNGTLKLSGSGTPGSGPLDIKSGALFDVSTTTAGHYVLAGGQSLTNRGTLTGGLIIGSGAHVSGGGQFAGAVTNLAGGLLTPGAGGDTNYFQSLTLAGGSTNQFWIGSATTYDMSTSSNSLNYAGGGLPQLQLDLNTYTWQRGDQFLLYNNLFSGMSAFDGTNAYFQITDAFGALSNLYNNALFSAVTDGGTATNWFSLNYAFNSGDGQSNDILLSAIPEPASMNLFVLAVSAYWLRRRLHGSRLRWRA